MSINTGRQGVDAWTWAALYAWAFKNLRELEYLDIVLNANNPPTVKAGSRFFVAKADYSFTSVTQTTNNNVLPGATLLSHPLTDIINEPADQVFTWGTGLFPTIANSTTYFLYCTGAEDTDETSAGKGVYGVSENAPTYDYEKGGWYSADGKVLATFSTDGGGVVGGLLIYGTIYPGYTANKILVPDGYGNLIESARSISDIAKPALFQTEATLVNVTGVAATTLYTFNTPTISGTTNLTQKILKAFLTIKMDIDGSNQVTFRKDSATGPIILQNPAAGNYERTLQIEGPPGTYAIHATFGGAGVTFDLLVKCKYAYMPYAYSEIV